MVYQICVIKGKNFSPYKRPIIKLTEFGTEEIPNEYVEFFDSMTSNFNNLEYWNDENDLHGETAVKVSERIRKVLQLLHSQGYTPYDKEPVHPYLQHGNGEE